LAYGSALFESAYYTGWDTDDDAQWAADKKYGTDKRKYWWYSGARIPMDENRIIPVDSNKYDTAICFQVIEHVEDDVAFVKELHRILKPGGKLYLTTPDRESRLKPGQKPWNPEHKREYHKMQLWGLLRRYFPEVEVSYVVATPEILEIERRRISKRWMRSLAPEWVVRVANRGKKLKDQNKHSTADFHCELDRDGFALDLFAECTK
jgi:SAM-dependent methyltransferase